jgi:pimeloyl-ACP methyl ester carboxylesterase
MSEYFKTKFDDIVAFDRRGSGPAFVFISGAGPYRATDPITGRTGELAAAQGLTTIVYDRLGRGESKAAGRIGLDRELAAISGLIGDAGGSAVLCGHSSGCAIALRAAAVDFNVTGVVLFEAPIFQIKGGATAWAAEVDRRISAGDLDGALAHYMKDMPPEWLESAKKLPIYPQMVANVVSYIADCEALAWAESKPLGELLNRQIPVEAIVGQQTSPLMIETARRIGTEISGATWKAIQGANHKWEPDVMATELVRLSQVQANAS